MFTRLLRRFYSSPTTLRIPDSIRRTYRPQLEALEDRLALSTITVDIESIPKRLYESPAEGNTTTSFKVTRVGGVGGHSVTVRYKVGLAGDSATLGDDYSPVKTSALQFGVNETVKYIDVVAKKDNVVEGNEKFQVRLTSIQVSNGGEGVFSNSLGTGIIKDANAANVVLNSESFLDLREGKSGFAYFRLQDDNRTPVTSKKPIVVQYRIEGDENANPRTELRVQPGVQGSITIPPGKSFARIEVTAKDDDIIEPFELFKLEIQSATNAVVPPKTSDALIGIRDNDKAAVSIRGTIRPSDESFTEGDRGKTNVDVQVILGSDIEKPIVVGYETKNGTAKAADRDFVNSSGEVRFRAGSKRGTRKTVTFQIIGDTKKEPTEQFFIDLLDNRDIRLVRDRFTVNIVDDDRAGAQLAAFTDPAEATREFSSTEDSSPSPVFTAPLQHASQSLLLLPANASRIDDILHDLFAE